jgi:chemotaxis protein CheD
MTRATQLNIPDEEAAAAPRHSLRGNTGSGIAQVFLEPGDFHFGAAPLRIATLLGSCVTVTLWHPRRHIGGMCHIQMAQRPPRHAATALDGHFADDAFALFDQAMARHGAAPHEFVVKLFGGGNMFPDRRDRMADVGAANLDATRALLAQRRMQPVVEHVGGAGHRKLIFDLASGDVWLAFKNLEKETARV